MGSTPQAQEETMRAATQRRPITAAVLAGAGLLLAACSGADLLEDSRAGLRCLDDSPECVEQRQSTLKSMIADKERTWVREPATPQAHASGVRLFAFRSIKAELSCEELSHARKEAEGAPKSLKAAPGLSPAQVSRASMFAGEVNKELAAEMKKRRCRA
jgi:hypothetical protein